LSDAQPPLTNYVDEICFPPLTSQILGLIAMKCSSMGRTSRAESTTGVPLPDSRISLAVMSAFAE
jgi:hypothetical protein